MEVNGLAPDLLQLDAQVLSGRGRACTISNRTLQARKHPMLGRLAHNVTFVRVTLVVAWISMVAVLAVLGLILDGMIS
jgi:hypothetical protein